MKHDIHTKKMTNRLSRNLQKVNALNHLLKDVGEDGGLFVGQFRADHLVHDRNELPQVLEHCHRLVSDENLVDRTDR